MSIPTPYLLAAGLAAGVAGWMVSGTILEGGRADARPETIAERNANSERTLFSVQAEVFSAETRNAFLEARGSTEASGKVAVRSETQGLLNARNVTKGQWVEEGELICTLNVGARAAEVQQMRAQLRKAELDYEAAKTLVTDGFATRTRVNTDKAAVDEAKAELKAAEIELERTKIKAPISGFVQDPFAKVGDMLRVGDTCANVVEPGTMTMIAQVSERFINDLELGGPASVRLVTGQEVEGTLKFIAPSADTETRTFRVEIDLPNPDNKIRDGITAMAKITLPSDDAHRIPASALTLDDTGRLGVRTVDEDGIVAFNPLKILGDAENGLWVEGLPDRVRVITRGQEYVIAGQKVDVVVKTAEAQQ
ncbi:MAG: efflux RND transporter periplasmic adaptor subunit [Pseudomonadota bacterium]